MITLLTKHPMLYLLIIFTLAAFLRFFGLNWDQGFHLHPDERAIIMFTTPLQFPKTITEFLSPQSPWNPHFFAYGSFPIYFLKIFGNTASIIDPTYATYDKINLLGRFLSAIFDIGTLLILFCLAKKLFSQSVGILASFFYALSVLPIQLSHFYAVDTPLTFFVLLTLYQLVRLYEKPTLIKSVLVGVFFGLSLATKTSALVLLSSIGIAIAIDFLLIFLKQPHRPHIWFPHLPKFLKRLFFDIVIIMSITVITFILFEPYALIDFQKFLRETLQTSQVMHNAFAFPFTLQYVGKIPYVYEVKNIFFFGLGIPLGTVCLLGVIFYSYLFIKEKRFIHKRKELIFLSFFVVYFLLIGKFAIGFMRYMLPLYPLFCLFGAIFMVRIVELLKQNIHSKFIRNTAYLILYASLFIWPLSFLSIYTKNNTRVLATDWILLHIPPKSSIAIEHWDDGLPLFGQQNYTIETLELYNPDSKQKWNKIKNQLLLSDYIILASNRLYIPLQKLTDCQKLPQLYCYKQTAKYYKALFSGQLGFKKVAEFSVFPKIPLLNTSIDDSTADESFTVYDHPKVIIFKKLKK